MSQHGIHDRIPSSSPIGVRSRIAAESSADDSEHAAVQPVRTNPTAPVPQRDLGVIRGIGSFPGIRRPWKSLRWLAGMLCGIGFLTLLLSALAAVPGLSLLTLGVLLSAEGDVARTARVRNAFRLLPLATRAGTACVCIGLMLIPVTILASEAAAQRIIAGSTAGPALIILLRCTQVLVITHAISALSVGGTVRDFVRGREEAMTWKGRAAAVAGLILLLPLGALSPVLPLAAVIVWSLFVQFRNASRVVAGIRTGEYTDQFSAFMEQTQQLLRPWHHLRVGFYGLLGAVIWLLIPTILLAAPTGPHQQPGGPALLGLLGAALMLPVAAWLPLLQAHQAATGRFRAVFEVSVARRIIRNVPIRWLLATVLLYALAVPLYFTKIRLPASDAVWLVTPLFIVLIFPARIFFGRIYAAGMSKPEPATRWLSIPIRLIAVPLLALYIGIVFVTPAVSEAGRRGLLENHAFGLPAPYGQLLPD